ncbi:MAG TPA: hypothetical protein VI279_00060 [Rhodocyclaceae bacterium]
MIWGTPELDTMISKLVMDSRDGSRQGFPMAVASELLWLAEINKVRRAMDLRDKTSIRFDEAYAMIEKGDAARRGSDTWSDPNSGGQNLGRRYADKPEYVRPHRRREENTWTGVTFEVLTHKYILLLIIAVLTIKSAWPVIKGFL